MLARKTIAEQAFIDHKLESKLKGKNQRTWYLRDMIAAASEIPATELKFGS